MEKINQIRQDTAYDNLVKRLGHCWGCGGWWREDYQSKWLILITP